MLKNSTFIQGDMFGCIIIFVVGLKAWDLEGADEVPTVNDHTLGMQVSFIALLSQLLHFLCMRRGETPTQSMHGR